MVLRDDAAATEVMTYVAWMFILIGCWLAIQRSSATKSPLTMTAAWPVALPTVITLLVAWCSREVTARDCPGRLFPMRSLSFCCSSQWRP